VSCGIYNRRSNDSQKEKLSIIDSIFQNENFDPTKVYSNPICLLYLGKPLLTIGQNIARLDTSLSFRPDPNLKYQEYYPIITDFISVDEYYTVKQSTGSLNGIIYFSADKSGRVFSISGSWLFDIDMTNETKQEALQTIKTKFFPCLLESLDFESKRKVAIRNMDFMETFDLVPPDNSKSGFGKWSINYEVKLRKNGL
jgi:hypothetical protein